MRVLRQRLERRASPTFLCAQKESSGDDVFGLQRGVGERPEERSSIGPHPGSQLPGLFHRGIPGGDGVWGCRRCCQHRCQCHENKLHQSHVPSTPTSPSPVQVAVRIQVRACIRLPCIRLTVGRRWWHRGECHYPLHFWGCHSGRFGPPRKRTFDFGVQGYKAAGFVKSARKVSTLQLFG